ncbi:RdgB/HAM1 family non-canonical purine NTP pyrophosphatase [Candidatus Bealeia paramacronuclearis]|uniref:dITP/XTP pyrophosphatase n=1 Tax=Candidatus Bealeia paramacronuclearis TaxID=1921001 RepID=A0ABZ2C6Q7_9PROT|nr:RdgB/HAM1 family non-canonical purine NTP pyrophosphatase [Candidatus Bealeia paramacronuclearis]
MKKLILATHNGGKVQELQLLLKPIGIEVLSSKDFNLIEPIEDGETFEANALIKAKSVFEATGISTLADDSGLMVSCLDGRPGVYSANWLGPQKDPLVAMARLQKEVADSQNLTAKFVTVLAFLNGGAPDFFKGECVGTLTFPPRGDQGFGFDPVFIPEGETRTFAQMTKLEKMAISHRGKALHAFLEFLKNG